MEEKIIFAISDVHGHFDEMHAALYKAGYNPLNEEHFLVVLGDSFDRGPDSVKVFNYLKDIVDSGRGVVLRGNHDKFLIDFLEGSNSPFNYIHNGLRDTIADFCGRTLPFESWCVIDKGCEITNEAYAEWVEECRCDINEELYPDLLPWLKGLPDYYETNSYIFVHGAIDTGVEDWHKPHCFRGSSLVDWDALSFDNGDFFGKEILNTDKTVVIGHFGTRYLRDMYPDLYLKRDDEDIDDVLVRNDGRVVAIDATTAASHKINVFVINDVLLGDSGDEN